MDNYGGEAFDLTTGRDIAKKKNKKTLIILIILVVIVLLGIIAGLIWGANYKVTHEIIPLEEDEGEIIAEGNYYPDVVGKIDEFQLQYTNNRNLILELADDDINEDATYIKNLRIFIYDDGTYQEKLSQAYNGENTDSFVLGTMDITSIQDYLHTNEEVFRGYVTLNEKYREEEEAIGKTFIAHYGDEISVVDEVRYQKQLYGLYITSEKEIIQNYEINNVE